MDQEIVKDVAKIKSPWDRLFVRCLMISVSVLFGLLIRSGNSNEKSLRDNLSISKAECDSMKLMYQRRIDAKQKELDDTKSSMLRGKQETIDELQRILKDQEKVKKSLKKLK